MGKLPTSTGEPDFFHQQYVTNFLGLGDLQGNKYCTSIESTLPRHCASVAMYRCPMELGWVSTEHESIHLLAK